MQLPKSYSRRGQFFCNTADRIMHSLFMMGSKIK